MRWPVLKLRYQLLLVMAVLVLIPMLSSALVVSNLVRNQNEKNARERISDVAEKLSYTVTSLQSEYLAKVKAFASTEEVVYSTYVLSQYWEFFSDRTKTNIIQPLRNSLLFYRASLEADLIELVDSDGLVLVSVGPGDDIQTAQELTDVPSRDHSSQALPASTRDTSHTAPGTASVNFHAQDGRLVLVAESAVTHKGKVIGRAVFRRDFDARFAEEMARTTGTDLAFFAKGAYVAGTLPAFPLPEPILAAAQDGRGPVIAQLSVDREPYNLAVSPLNRGQAEGPMVVVGMSNLDTVRNTRQTVRSIFLVAFLGIIVSTVFTFVWAGNVTRPINLLVKGTKQVAAGKLDEQIETGRRDELGELAAQFNAMTRSLKQNTEELLSLKELNQNIVESIDVGLVVVDGRAKVLATNAALERRFGLKRDSLIGRDVSHLLPPSEDERFAGVLLELATSPGHAEATDVHRKARDRVQICNLEAFPLRDGAGRVSGKIILIDDVTERAHLVEQLIRSEKLASVGKLAAGLAHEINNPLGTIVNYVQTLLLDERDPEAREYLLSVEAETKRISQIVRDLLNFARQSPPHFGPVDVHAVLDESLRLVEYQHSPGMVEVIRGYCDSPVTVLGDGNQLKQAFVNLLINAFQAMPEGGVLTVTTRLDEDADGREVCRIAFRDTGTGISEDALRYIFDPFFTTKEVGRGTGLGLFVTFGIIQAHSGLISVDTQVGRGSTFTVSLPVAR